MRRIFRLALIALLLPINGCALFQETPAEERVAQRAQEWLDLLMSGQMERSYGYTTPGYRSIRTLGQYAVNWVGSGMWLSANVARVDCTDLVPTQRCEAVIKVHFKAARQAASETHFRETWLLLDHQWYLYQKP